MSFYKNINAIKRLEDIVEPHIDEVLLFREKLVRCVKYSDDLNALRFEPRTRNHICMRCIGCIRGFNVRCGEDVRKDHTDIVIRPVNEKEWDFTKI